MNNRSPLLGALYNMTATLPMHMPGHKRNPSWGAHVSGFGKKGIYDLDFTEVPGLDDLHAPEGIIFQAQKLAALCFKAKHTFFLVNGATVGITAAIMACCKEGDKVLVPRNAHRCVFEGLVLSGATPVYFQPEYNLDLSVPLGPQPGHIHDLIAREKPSALILIHPTYHGAGCDLSLIQAAKENEIFTIVDESHGSHFCFDSRLPMSAVEAGADIVVHSTHKTLGSLTQTGLLHLAADTLDPEHMAAVLSLLQSTSPSYPLMASLDAMRADLVCEGTDIVGRAVDLAMELRKRISRIKGFSCGELDSNCGGVLNYGYDPTKILLQSSLLKGFELGALLRREYNIYPELEEERFVLLMITVGDTMEGIEQLIAALRDISSKQAGCLKADGPIPDNMTMPGSIKPGGRMFDCPTRPFDSKGHRSISPAFNLLPKVVLSPRQAFYAPKQRSSLRKAAGQVSGSLVVPYPPGVPLLCPGEGISSEIVEYLYQIVGKNAHIQGLFRNGNDLELLVLEC